MGMGIGSMGISLYLDGLHTAYSPVQQLVTKVRPWTGKVKVEGQLGMASL